ncbi:MAG: CBS and ACT domain-containing protein [Spirochaetia bacterium]
MRVSRIMTHNPIYVDKEIAVPEAQRIIRRENIHRVPVLDKKHHIVGIVSEKDLLYASPSPASTLDVYEMNALLAKLTVDKVMTKEVITVSEDSPIEEAVRLLADNDIGGLPVMRGQTLVGIITESDIFRMFIELFGARSKGIQATVLLPEKPGELAQITAALSEKGANIISIGTFPGDNVENRLCYLKVSEISKSELKEVLKPYILNISDIRES